MRKKVLTYTQCTMEKLLVGGARLITVSWIPTQFAKRDKVLELRNHKDEAFEADWRVVHVGATRDADFVEDRSRDYLRQRGVSDI